jgi:hypothetical protein
MFEVGKRYSHIKYGRIVEVLWRSDTSIVVRYTDHPGNDSIVVRDRELLWSIRDTWPYWIEYHEPVIVERYINIYKDGEEKATWPTREMADRMMADNRVGVLKLTLTDDWLTSVEILEN